MKPQTFLLSQRYICPPDEELIYRQRRRTDAEQRLAGALLDWLKDGGAAQVRYLGGTERVGSLGLLECDLRVALKPVPPED